MSLHFEILLAEIREAILLMSSLVDRNFADAIKAFVERNTALANSVELGDSKIDEMEITVDEMVITHMATHGPVARDCRLMLAAAKLSMNLESIGDQATTIARRTRVLNAEPPLTSLHQFEAMAKLAQEMLKDSITAFVDGRFELAEAVIPRDKEVDALNRNIAQQMTELMIKSSENVNRAIHLMTIAKAIERAADHAKSIAEEVFYLHSGEDIRHKTKTKLEQI
jgi:phosphate transport system protein